MGSRIPELAQSRRVEVLGRVEVGHIGQEVTELISLAWALLRATWRCDRDLKRRAASLSDAQAARLAMHPRLRAFLQLLPFSRRVADMEDGHRRTKRAIDWHAYRRR